MEPWLRVDARSDLDLNVCQPFSGYRGDDPQFPKKYQHDPWCWAPGLGLHRSSAPKRRFLLRSAPGSTRVGPDFIDRYQALVLGYGSGTTNTGETMPPEFIHRFTEVEGPARFSDAESFARFGHTVRGYADLPQGRPDSFNRAVFSEAYRLMGPLPETLLGPWNSLLDLATAGQPIQPEDQAWADRTTGAKHPHTAADREVERDLCAYRVLYALTDGGHSGDSRSMARLFSLSQPTELRASRWLEAVGEAIAANLRSLPVDT